MGKKGKKQSKEQIKVTAAFRRVIDCNICKSQVYMDKNRRVMWCLCGPYDATLNIQKEELWKPLQEK